MSIAGALVALIALAAVVGGYGAYRDWQAIDAYRPEIHATPENAAAGALWAELPTPVDLDAVALYHDALRDEHWAITWTGSPEAVDRFVGESGLTTPFGPCAGPQEIRGIGQIRLDDCHSAEDYWRKADGNYIGRKVIRGRLPAGTHVVSVDIVDPN